MLDIKLYNTSGAQLKLITIDSTSYDISCNDKLFLPIQFPETKDVILTFEDGTVYKYSGFIKSDTPWPKNIDWKKTLEDIITLNEFYIDKVKMRLSSIMYDEWRRIQDKVYTEAIKRFTFMGRTAKINKHEDTK